MMVFGGKILSLPFKHFFFSCHIVGFFFYHQCVLNQGKVCVVTGPEEVLQVSQPVRCFSYSRGSHHMG